jgi:hypothetical protein
MKIILFAGLILLTGIGGYFYFSFPSYSWHQKMTIEVAADGKAYSGSSVVRVRWRKNGPLGAVNGPAWIKSVKGEAPFVEIPGHGVLFALLSSSDQYNYTADLAFCALGRATERLAVDARCKMITDELGAPHIVLKDQYLLFVTFTSNTNPRSVQRVNSGDLAAAFGRSVNLKSVILEITDAPVTAGHVETILGWLGPYPEPKLGPATGKTTNITLLSPRFAGRFHLELDDDRQ